MSTVVGDNDKIRTDDAVSSRADALDPTKRLGEKVVTLNERTAEILRQRSLAPVLRRGWLVKRLLLAADLSALMITATLSEVAANGLGELGIGDYLWLFALTLPGWVLGAKLVGLYDHDEASPDHSTLDDVGKIFRLVTLGAWVLVAGTWATGLSVPDIGRTACFWAFAIVGVTFARVLARTIAKRQIMYLQNTVIVGHGDVAQLVARKLLLHPEYGLNLIGYVAAGDERGHSERALGGLSIIGEADALEEIVRLFDVERVIIATQGSDEEALEIVRSLSGPDVQINIVPRLFEIVSPTADMHSVEGLPLIGLPRLRLSRTSRLLKRATDVMLSGLALVLLAPLFAIVGLAITLEGDGPVFFRQVRMGAQNKTFMLIKFRTMVLDADAQKADLAIRNRHALYHGDPMFKVEDDPRVTRVGRGLRRYFIDELPQLINVFKGEMSLVGPRPLILEEDKHVSEWARHRLNLKPGMTGLWQVLGRNAISFDEMIRLDCLYVTTWSLGTDLKLLCRTIPVALKGGGGSF